MSTLDGESSQRAELLSSSALFILALLPNHVGRFGILAWATVAILRDVVSRFSPSGTMKILPSLIATTNEALALAQATVLYQIIPLMDDRRRLREAEKHASKLRCELLVLSRHPWGVNFARTYSLWRNISKCIEEVKDIHNSIQFILEADVQRKLDDEIQAMQRSRSIENGEPVQYICTALSSINWTGITHIRTGSRATEASLPSMA